MGKNLVNFLGKITQDDQIKMLKKAGRDSDIENGRKSFNRIHKDKKKEDNRNSCRNYRD